MDAYGSSAQKKGMSDWLAAPARVAVFIDAANILYSLHRLGWKIDYARLQRYFLDCCGSSCLYFYTSYFTQDQGRRNLLEMLESNGFLVRAKEVKKIVGKSGTLYKGNCDVELAIDMVSLVQTYDVAVLMSGDSDFVPLIRYAQAYGRAVVAISARGHVAREVVQAADAFFPLPLFRESWESLKNQETPP